MPRSNAASTVGDMFDDLKVKLGFGRSEDSYDDEYDYEPADSYNAYEEFDSYEDEYSDGASVGGYRPASPYANRFNRNDISSSLVSIDDVKASTPLPDRIQRDPAPSTAEPYSPLRSNAPDFSSMAATVPSIDVPSRDAGSSSRSSYDPYEAYSASDPVAHAPARSLTVVRPVAYSDVERIARAVKSGDVVVLAMRATPDDLSKRILDFSFGVASALDANVECPGEKVFAIARGSALSDAEKSRLRIQGVL